MSDESQDLDIRVVGVLVLILVVLAVVLVGGLMGSEEEELDSRGDPILEVSNGSEGEQGFVQTVPGGSSGANYVEVVRRSDGVSVDRLQTLGGTFWGESGVVYDVYAVRCGYGVEYARGEIVCSNKLEDSTSNASVRYEWKVDSFVG